MVCSQSLSQCVWSQTFSASINYKNKMLIVFQVIYISLYCGWGKRMCVFNCVRRHISLCSCYYMYHELYRSMHTCRLCRCRDVLPCCTLTSVPPVSERRVFDSWTGTLSSMLCVPVSSYLSTYLSACLAASCAATTDSHCHMVQDAATCSAWQDNIVINTPMFTSLLNLQGMTSSIVLFSCIL